MLLTVTDTARDKILELRDKEDGPAELGLRIEVTGVRGVEYTYDLTFDPLAEADPDAGDVVEHQGELPVIIPVDSIDALRGATLDMPSTDGQAGLVLRNPNRPDPLSGAHLELTGTTEEKIRPRSHRGRGGLRDHGRRVPGLRGVGHDPARRHLAVDRRGHPRDHRGVRRDRPQHGREPVLRVKMCVTRYLSGRPVVDSM